MSNENIYKDYRLKFDYILIGYKNDFEGQKLYNYVELLNNEEIISSLFIDTARNILKYSDIYDVDIKFIDDIKIMCFLSMNIYKIIEKDTSFTKKYLIFHSMLYRFKKHLPYKDYNNKIIIKLTHMFTNLSSYDELIVNNGQFGLFQILKSIYNLEKDFFDNNITCNNNQEYEDNIYEDNIYEENELITDNPSDIRDVDSALEEISLNDWNTSNTRIV